jgi:hypothetical protein
MTGLPTPNTKTIEPIIPIARRAFTWSWEARSIFRPGLYESRRSRSFYRVFAYLCWVHNLRNIFSRYECGGGERLRQAVATKHKPRNRWLKFFDSNLCTRTYVCILYVIVNAYNLARVLGVW